MLSLPFDLKSAAALSNPPSTISDQALRASFWLHWLRRPGVAVPALYALSSTIGLLFHWTYFQRFDIDFLAYIDTADLLLASFRRPGVWLILLTSIVTVHLDNLSSARYGRKPHSRWTAWYGRPGYRRANLLMGLLMVTGLIVLWAHTSAERLREGEGLGMRLQFAEDGSQVSGRLIGTTSRFVFLYHPELDHSRVYPFESLSWMETQAAPAPAAQPDPQPTAQSDVQPGAGVTAADSGGEAAAAKQ